MTGNRALQLSTAYAVCRGITRSQAKNFYYGFLVLPQRKRNALCAVYAFMRHADDISDDAGLSPAFRREKLSGWMQALHDAVQGNPTDDPVLYALADTQRNFEVPLDWLDKLVHGTLMDVSEPEGSGRWTAGPSGGAGSATLARTALSFRTFEDLYQYCYHVASVVGLVSIRIFGYRDPKAERLAEQLGVAFQLTNILRDVKEDAAMSRVYLPERDMETFGLGVDDLMRGVKIEQLRPVLQMEAERALEYYNSATELIPLVEDDSQPALWALAEIYRRLLQKIIDLNYNVLEQRVRLTTAEKLNVLAQGFLRRLT